MPFQLDARQREVRFEFAEEGVALIFRERTEEEHDEFDKGWSKVVNAPTAGLKQKEAEERFARRKRAFLKEWARRLLIGWEGIQAEGVDVELTTQTADAFFASAATVRYWNVLGRHFWPNSALKDREEEEPSFRPS